MPFPLGISDSQKKQPPLPPSVVSQSDSGSGRDFDNGASFLTFQGTTFTGKLPIIDYTVTAIDTSTAEVLTQTVNTVNPFVFTGLRSGRNYRFSIRARNAVFSSVDSSQFGPGLATTVPARTTSVGATNSGNGGGATLAWSAPANGGKSISSYLITPNIGTPVETGNSSTTYGFSTLTVGSVYNFTVAARNENGLGQASTTSNPITITAPPPPPQFFAPSFFQQVSFFTSPPAGTPVVTFTNILNRTSSSFTVAFSGTGFRSWIIQADGGTIVGSGTGDGVSGGGDAFVQGLTVNSSYNFLITLWSGSGQTGSIGQATVTGRTLDVEPPVFTTQFFAPPNFNQTFFAVTPFFANPGFVQFFTSPSFFQPPTFNFNSTFFNSPTFQTTFTPTFTQQFFNIPFVQFFAAPRFFNIPFVQFFAAPRFFASARFFTFGGSGGCWGYGTPITLLDGSFKAIEDLVAGDVLLSPVIPTYPNGEDVSEWYPASKWSTKATADITYEPTTVKAVRHVVEPNYFRLNSQFRVTGDHFLFVRKGDTWQFCTVYEIEVGDHVYTGNETTVEITSKIRVDEQLMVVDIDVEDNDLFFASGMITHNVKLLVT